MPCRDSVLNTTTRPKNRRYLRVEETTIISPVQARRRRRLNVGAPEDRPNRPVFFPRTGNSTVRPRAPANPGNPGSEGLAAEVKTRHGADSRPKPTLKADNATRFEDRFCDPDGFVTVAIGQQPSLSRRSAGGNQTLRNCSAGVNP